MNGYEIDLDRGMTPHVEVFFDGDGKATVVGAPGASTMAREYRIEDQVLTSALSRTLPPHLADLLDVAMAVYLADRVVRRRRNGDPRFALAWQRRLRLHLPVRDPGRWDQPQVQDALRRALRFLTEDDWEFDFTRRDRELRGSERQQPLFPTDFEPPVQVALFSGGLDSLAGAAVDVAKGTEGSLILLGGATHGRLESVIGLLFREIRRSAVRDVRPILLRLGMRQPEGQYNRNERSQRSRGFLYAAIGAIAAAMAGGEEVLFYENGIGAINLPYSPTQFGTHSTRSTNPVALGYEADFLKTYLERPMYLRLPNLFATKGEMCARLAHSPLRESIKQSVTCDGFPLREKKAAQCGVCTSCLLRRQSLQIAGLGAEDPGELYLYDPVDRPDDVKDKRWNVLRDMLGQVDTFRCALVAPEPWEALSAEYPLLRAVEWALEDRTEFGRTGEVRGQLLSLLERYCYEWECFTALPPGWQFGAIDYTGDWRLHDVS